MDIRKREREGGEGEILAIKKQEWEKMKLAQKAEEGEE